jgi:nitrite reductase/ring-hydroxylating ferredoxin subunit
MDLTRRQVMTAAAAGATTLVATCGCGTSATSSSPPSTGNQPSRTRGPVDAGSLSEYPSDGVYDRFAASHDFFVVQENNRVFAVSAICTHRHCPLKRVENGIKCRCHGSTFTASGHVTRGPARQDLARFPVERDTAGHLIVHADRPPIAPDAYDAAGAFVAVS